MPSFRALPLFGLPAALLLAVALVIPAQSGRANGAPSAPAARPAAFAACAPCHAVQANARSTAGPNLWGIKGRRAAGVAGYRYSPAMQAQTFRWDRARLIAFITNPQQAIPGTSMRTPGVKDPVKARELADYLMGLQ